MDRTTQTTVITTDRHCKNCNELVAAGKTYCGNCGAKWIDKPVTLQNVANDFSDMYLGFDNRFLQTFLNMFSRPQLIINGYINGRRGRYMEAVRYTLLAVFFAGMYTLVLKKVDPSFTVFNNDSLYRSLGYTDQMITDVNNLNDKWLGFLLDYQGLIILLSIPLYAIFARITFWKESRYYNFTEHMVFFLYVFAHSSIISSVISLISLAIDIDYFLIWIYSFIPLQIFYTAYCYKKCFRLNLWQITLKTIRFLIVLFFSYLAIIIAAVVIGILLKIAGII